MPAASTSMITNLWEQLRGNPVNWLLVGLLACLTRAYFRQSTTVVPKPLPHKPRVFETLTPMTLARYDGRQDPSLPIYLAVKGKVYDVTPGRNFYGPEGPYGNFAGRDASRGLAKGSFDLEMITPLDQPIDSLSDLTAEEWDALNDWEGLFSGKYDCVGELVEPEVLEKRNNGSTSVSNEQ